MLNKEQIQQIEKIIEKSQKIGISSDYKIRNLRIFLKFNTYRNERKMGYDESIGKLSKEYFLSHSTVQMIISKLNSRSNSLKNIAAND